MTREEDIKYDFLENDRIWPPFIVSSRGHPFIQALVEVLKRLPDEAYDVVSDHVLFVVEDDRFIAFNAPFDRYYPPSKSGLNVTFRTIVVFHTALAYPQAVLMGILAHEIAHSFVSLPEYQADEAAADDLVVRWGFGGELEALRSKQKKA